MAIVIVVKENKYATAETHQHSTLLSYSIYSWCIFNLSPLFQYERIYNFPQEAFNVRIDEEEDESEVEEEGEEEDEKEEEVETDEDVEGELEREVVEEERRAEVRDRKVFQGYHSCFVQFYLAHIRSLQFESPPCSFRWYMNFSFLISLLWAWFALTLCPRYVFLHFLQCFIASHDLLACFFFQNFI